MATANTPLGAVTGTDLGDCERYAGIRYAKAPVGDLRFAAPVPIEPWDGTYDATNFGAAAPQIEPVAGGIGLFGSRGTNEDCLFLNVFTPKADDAKRPVLVWIHGGAYAIGSGEMYDGSSFVRRGDVVVVTLNYRLGVLGWIPFDHLDPALAGSGNNGVRDQIEALRWVRDNISSFGGDPDNVTIFGESAGGGSVSAILAAPSADDLYHKAILQSAPPGFGEAVGAEAFTDGLLTSLGAPGGGIDALRSVPIGKLIEAQTAQGAIDRLGRDAEHSIDGVGAGFHPVVDGVVVTRTVVDSMEDVAKRNVPLIIGTNEDEGTLFTLILPQDVTDDEVASSLITVEDPASMIAAYRARGTGRPILVDLMTDAVFRIPSLRVADAAARAGVPVWVYLFTWKTPVFGGFLGATHALELPFVWDALDDEQWKQLVGEAPPRAIAEAMQDAWLSFAKTGDPNTAAIPSWPIYNTDTRPTLTLNEQITVENDPVSDVRKLWYAQTKDVVTV